MTEPSWAEGYVVDIDYTDGYYRELAPEGLRFVALLAGLQAADASQGFNYCELGCGNGRSVVLHAAADPRGKFYGIDFNPTHIHNARKLAQDSATANAVFLEKSFAELSGSDLPEMDFITLHGVHSWISDEHRLQIADFIRVKLRPGGLVYVSYNCLPGLAPVDPMRRLLVRHAALGGGDLIGRIRGAIDFVTRLEQAGADYFQANPIAKLRLASLRDQNPGYLAHEYFNENWSPAYHADVCAEMAAAKASYIGSANVIDNFDQFSLKPGVAALLAGIGDRAMVETVKDFARNMGFRRDVFARGAPKAALSDLESTLGRQRFSLARPRALCHLGAKVPAGEVTLQKEAHAPVLNALARTPMTFDELAGAPEMADLDRLKLRQAIFALAALGNVMPALPAAGEIERRASTARYNKAVLAGPITGGNLILASPVWGCGVPLNLIDRLLLNAPRNHADAVEFALKAYLNSGARLRKKDKAVDSTQEARAMIDERTAYFFSDLLPFFRQVGVVE